METSEQHDKMVVATLHGYAPDSMVKGDKEIALVQADLPTFLEQVKALSVVDQESYDLGIGISVKAEVRIRKIKEITKPNIQRWHEGHQRAIQEQKDLLAPWEAIKGEINPKCATWLRLEERRRDLEAIRLREEGRKKEEEARLAQAEALEQAGEHEAAEAVISAPIQAVAVEAPPPIEKGDGVGTRQGIWKHKVVNLITLVKAVAAGQQPIALLMENDAGLGQIARATKGQAVVPGVMFYQEQGKIQHRIK